MGREDSAPRRRRSRASRRGYARVWTDPAVVQSEAEAQVHFEDWRQAFIDFLNSLPEERKALLRRRVGRSPHAA